jgi:flagellar M-ring protein FliF
VVLPPPIDASAAQLAGPTESGPDGQSVALAGPADTSPSAPAQEDDTLLNVANVEGRLRASSIRKLADVVETHPETALTIVRGWLTARAT